MDSEAQNDRTPLADFVSSIADEIPFKSIKGRIEAETPLGNLWAAGDTAKKEFIVGIRGSGPDLFGISAPSADPGVRAEADRVGEERTAERRDRRRERQAVNEAEPGPRPARQNRTGRGGQEFRRC